MDRWQRGGKVVAVVMMAEVVIIILYFEMYLYLLFYSGLLKTLESEREDLSKRSQAIAVEETKLASERSSLDQEREYLHKEQERLSELAKKIPDRNGQHRCFLQSMECTQKEVEGKQALAEARRQDSINQSRLNDISVRLEELKVGEKRFAEERLQLHSERKQLESLKSRQLCAGCKQPVSRNPYFSLSTPLMQTRPSPSSLVGVVAPQKLDLTDPTLLQYKIQADQDSDFLNEESAYLDALKYSPYHNNSVSQI
ncbi:hypothetical protein EB796_009526 [Bugula neritina]|uniref:Fas-binding factor 1 C-terminal domain-containing protein n=1 Tax=Bugula neritina TaxID=10212 RepID=A0A7J7K0L1_BUGNE|nr:hypothetical protein EB796_009526 [Bugula neritina]